MGDHDQTRAATPFGFGANWKQFLDVLDDERIAEAERSLLVALDVADLKGVRFLDIGSGSGLFSLAAMRLGATWVHSFDYDADSVECTTELRRRYFFGNSRWVVERGSILDRGYIASLGTFDIVYSWGVLHHTGAMWDALANACDLVGEGGCLFVALYNDQGGQSVRWRRIKRLYNQARAPIPQLLVFAVGSYGQARTMLIRIVRRQNPIPLGLWRKRRRPRGMSAWHDLVDWVGGYPFEVARPEQAFDFCRQRGFTLERLTTAGGGHGCNEFVFRRDCL